MSCITIMLLFNANDTEAKKLLNSTWLFKIAFHKMSSIARQPHVLPDVGWNNSFRNTLYEIIPNRLYADGAY